MTQIKMKTPAMEPSLAMRALKLVVLTALLGYVGYGLHNQAEALSGALTLRMLAALAAAVLCLLLNQVAMACRQSLLLSHVGSPLPMGQSLRIILAGLFANNFMPAGVGHDVARMVFLRGHHQQTTASLGGLVLLDRFLGLMGLSVLAACSLLTLWNWYPLAVPGEAGRLLISAMLMPLPLGLTILALRHEATFERLSGLAGRLPLGGKIQNLLVGMRAFSSRKRVLLMALGLASLGYVFAVAGVALLAWGVSDFQGAIGSTLVSPLVFFASSIPVTPSNLGWTEAVADAAWNIFGMHGGMVVFIYWRIATGITSLLGYSTYCSYLNSTLELNNDR